MSVFQLPLVTGNANLGDLISLGQKVVLFTALPELASLDGKTFEGREHALQAAIQILRSTSPRDTAAA